MIALPQDLPLVCWQGKREVPLSAGWLAETIDRSARRAGYAAWPGTPDVLGVLLGYLRREFHGTLISAGELQQLIRASLRHSGYADVARQLTLIAPRAVIYLPELAGQAGFELLFFHRLNTCLEEIAWLAVGGVKLEGLRQAVKMLRHAGHWGGDCADLSAEIVAFCRRKLAGCHHDDIDLVII
ncbi:MAG: hypothetical protein LBK71_03275 [Verrucomicrobiales bacterium]|jgi:hypothetical protein|nr:hypothetical protein [Verrucomicrobiales bacterium]MDR1304241.1 hypothetical protein [Verrucomicrobiales bacterium]